MDMELLGFYSPSNTEEVLALIGEKSNAKLLGGGTDLVLELGRDKICADYLISLAKIKELKGITEDKKNIYIGSMTTFTGIMESKLIQENYNSLIECGKHMGSPQIRNAATIGGNIANAGSAADIVPCIMSLEGELEIKCLGKVRKVSCVEYFKNYSSNKMGSNELLTRIIIPKTKVVSGYYKLGKRNSLAIARLSGAISFKLALDKVTKLKLSLGAVGRYPQLVSEVGNMAEGRSQSGLLDSDIIDYLGSFVEDSIRGRKTMPFKMEAVKGVYRELVNNALDSLTRGTK
jgi:CO/xanthine dehydrogenase FAD-binding subunit